MHIILKYTLVVFFCCLPARSICGEAEEFPSPSVDGNELVAPDFSNFVNTVERRHVDVCKDICGFWQYVNRETFNASRNILYEERKNMDHQRAAYDMRKIVKLYELDKAVGLNAACLYFFSTRKESTYRLLLMRYMSERLELLRTKASRDDVSRWFEEQESIFYSRKENLARWDSACANYASACIEYQEKQELKEKAIIELTKHYKQAREDLILLEYVYQKLYLIGFCLSVEEYSDWIRKCEEIIHLHHTDGTNE